MTLTLANKRNALLDFDELQPAQQKQLRALLAGESLGSLTKARANDELRIDVVDLIDAEGTTRYQYYAWPFGSGVLYAHDSTRAVATVTQHGFVLEKPDAELLRACRSAFARAPELGLDRVDVDSISRPVPVPTKPTRSFAELLALDEIGNADWYALLRVAWPELFPHQGGKRNVMTLRPYPKLRANELGAPQRAVLERMIELQRSRMDLAFVGVFFDFTHNASLLGHGPAAASDVLVDMAGDRLPLWYAVSHVSSGHMDPAPLVAAFAKLPAASALAAWTEIASGAAYDLCTAHPSKRVDSANSAKYTPSQRKHRTRFYDWMASASVQLGEAGERAAAAQLELLPESDAGHPRTNIAMLSLARHARARKQPLDPCHAPWLHFLKCPPELQSTRWHDAYKSTVAEIEKAMAITPGKVSARRSS